MLNLRPHPSRLNLFLLLIAFAGIFVYGMLTALPGTVLPKLERDQFLANDALIATFLLVNAAGAVFSYLISGPIIDLIGNRFALLIGLLLVISSMLCFAFVVSSVAPASALFLLLACSLALGLGANVIVSAGHALVAEVASSWRNSALNLLDVCFGLGLMTLPLLANALQQRGGLSAIFWFLAGATFALLLLCLLTRFPKPAHSSSLSLSEAKGLFSSGSFWALGAALFMYVGAEVAVGKWVVTYLERDARLLMSAGVDAEALQRMGRAAPEALSAFFEQDPVGMGVAQYALRTLALFGLALLVGRLVSSFLLGVMRVKSLVLLSIGSAIATIGVAVMCWAGSASGVRWAVFITGMGMGPIFPTTVGLASVIGRRMAGTAMSWVMGIGFAGLLVIPPAVGYISEAVGGEAGDVRKGMRVVMVAVVVMTMLHVGLAVRGRRRGEEKEEGERGGAGEVALSEEQV